jgi:LmbE family N-acetylglucosaminyl deacetylase
MPPRPPCAIAIAAHPDDIEYVMAGTLLKLRQAGWETHYLNLSSGNCGSTTMDRTQTAKVRRLEARGAAAILGAVYHESVADDLEIIYSVGRVREVAAVIRKVAPQVVLTHSPQDYMEDHTETCRIAVTAAFAHGVPNFETVPPRPALDPAHGITVYHAMPHGLCNGLRQKVRPGAYVNVTDVHAVKMQALAAHASQQSWLQASQGMNSYLQVMEDMSLEVGRLSGQFKLAEGWRRHLHYGFSPVDDDPLAKALGASCLIDHIYEAQLNQPV